MNARKAARLAGRGHNIMSLKLSPRTFEEMRDFEEDSSRRTLSTYRWSRKAHAVLITTSAVNPQRGNSSSGNCR